MKTTHLISLLSKFASLTIALLMFSGCGPQRTEEEKEGTLVYGFKDNLRTFDPVYAIYSQEGGIIPQVIEPLVRWNHDIELEPHLASKFYTTDDCTTWVFELRQGVTFHDGTPFTSEAVKLHFDRTLDPATGAKRRRNIEDVVEVVTPDDYTVEFRLRGPNCIFPERMGDTFACIPHPSVIDDPRTFAYQPIGTGPFILEDWDRDSMVVKLRRNPNYWKGDVIKFENLEFQQIVENTTRLILLEQNTLDMADLSNAQVAVVKKNKDLVLQSKPQLSIRYIGFNNMKPPFDNPLVRQAVNHAINKEDIVEYTLFGVGSPARGPLPTIMPAFNPNVREYEYDPDKARALLKEAGLTPPIKVDAWTYESGDYRKIMEATMSYMAEVGFDVNLQIYDNAAYWNQFDQYQTIKGEWFPTKPGVFDLFVGGWVGGETAHGFLDPLFRGPTGPQSLSTSNSAFYDNELVNNLLAQFKKLPDPDDRIVLYKEIQEQIADDAPWIFTFYGQVSVGVHNRVQNFQVHPGGRIYFENVTLDGKGAGL